MRTVAVTALLLLVGCGPSFDEDGFDLVVEYADDQTGAIESVLLIDLDDELERSELAGQIEAVNNDYLDRDDWPAREDIEGWMLNRSQGDRTWTVEGPDLAAAVADLEYMSEALADDLRHESDREYLVWTVEDSLGAVEDLRSVLSGR